MKKKRSENQEADMYAWGCNVENISNHRGGEGKIKSEGSRNGDAKESKKKRFYPFLFRPYARQIFKKEDERRVG